MAMFTKHQIVNVELACKLQAGTAYPSIMDSKWVVQSNQIKDCPVTAQDVNVALKIWGPSVALLKGKTVRRMPPGRAIYNGGTKGNQGESQACHLDN
jgi:hypothetical protein